jgi:hypothetical protein
MSIHEILCWAFALLTLVNSLVSYLVGRIMYDLVNRTFEERAAMRSDASEGISDA